MFTFLYSKAKIKAVEAAGGCIALVTIMTAIDKIIEKVADKYPAPTIK